MNTSMQSGISQPMVELSGSHIVKEVLFVGNWNKQVSDLLMDFAIRSRIKNAEVRLRRFPDTKQAGWSVGSKVSADSTESEREKSEKIQVRICFSFGVNPSFFVAFCYETNNHPRPEEKRNEESLRVKLEKETGLSVFSSGKPLPVA